MRKITFLLITAIVLSSLLAFTAQAQERPGSIRATYEFFGYPTGVSELVHTGSLTKEQKDSIEAVKLNYDEFVKEILPVYPCKDFYLELAAYSDWQPFEGVTPEMSDKLNDILALDRLRKSSRFLIDEKGVPESCLDRDLNVVYADSDVRGVRIRVRYRELPTVTTDKNIDKGVIDDIDERISKLEDDVAQLREDMEAENDRQDERIDKNSANIADNSARLNDHEKRLSLLEEQKASSTDFSAHLGVGVEHFADQMAPVISAGVQIGEMQLSGWYGFMSDIGTETIDTGTVGLRRETYGGMATWYPSVLQTNHLSFGPSIGWERGEDAIRGEGSYLKVYESILAGASLDVAISNSLHIEANLSYAPVIKSYSYDNSEFQAENMPIRGSVALQLRFN